MKYELPDNNPFSPHCEVKPYNDKPRRKAYRHILAGLRYHKGEKLSFVTIGFKRGSIIDVRTFLKKLTTFIKRYSDIRIDYCRMLVWDNNSPDGLWRVHIHMIWNAPYLKQSLLVEKLEEYIGETGHVYIKLLDGEDKKTARYLMQYLGNQDGFVRFSYSRNWLPKGYSKEWDELKSEFFKPVPTGYQTSKNASSEMVDSLITRNSPEWRKAGLIENMNSWIDEQRDKPKRFGQSQMDANGEIFYVEQSKAKNAV